MRNKTSSGLSLQSDGTDGRSEPATERDRTGRGDVLVLLAVFIVALGGLGVVGYRMHQRTEAMERQVASLTARTEAAAALAREATDRAMRAEGSARTAADARRVAETQAADAREQTTVAQQEAVSARETAARAEAEAERVRKSAEAELNRLETALGQIAETRRTALGLVMNLGSDYLKFEFDKAELRPGDRELLSRVAGILLSSQDYSVSVNGHTDDVGSEAYNKKLSEQRAGAVRDYLVKAGLPAEILTVTGHGKALPLLPGRSEKARAKNRRVELGIANTRIVYGRSATNATPSPDR